VAPSLTPGYPAIQALSDTPPQSARCR
jgi:hypothetical protein